MKWIFFRGSTRGRRAGGWERRGGAGEAQGDTGGHGGHRLGTEVTWGGHPGTHQLPDHQLPSGTAPAGRRQGMEQDLKPPSQSDPNPPQDPQNVPRATGAHPGAVPLVTGCDCHLLLPTCHILGWVRLVPWHRGEDMAGTRSFKPTARPGVPEGGGDTGCAVTASWGQGPYRPGCPQGSVRRARCPCHSTAACPGSAAPPRSPPPSAWCQLGTQGTGTVAARLWGDRPSSTLQETLSALCHRGQGQPRDRGDRASPGASPRAQGTGPGR